MTATASESNVQARAGWRAAGTRRQALAALAAVPMTALAARAASATPGSQRSIIQTTGRNSPARQDYGAAIRPEQLDADLALGRAIRQLDLLVPEYHGQWDAVEWRRGQPWFGNYDAIVQFAEVFGQRVRGHSLLWEQMTPAWARADLAENRSWAPVRQHFRNLLERYRNRIEEWVVVNEMLDTEDGVDGLRRTSFQRAFGNGYVATALRLARAFDPHARLMINDYSLCHDNPVDERRRQRLLALVEQLKAHNVPLDMVGIQGHLELAKGPLPVARLRRFLRDLAATGVQIAFTEVDVLEDDRRRPLAQRDGRVADMVASLLDLAGDPAVTSVTFWGLRDSDSWLQERASATMAALQQRPVNAALLNRGLPFDCNMQPKQLQRMILAGLPQSRFARMA